MCIFQVSRSKLSETDANRFRIKAIRVHDKKGQIRLPDLLEPEPPGNGTSKSTEFAHRSVRWKR